MSGFWQTDAIKAADAAAKKAGISMADEGIELRFATIEATWGELCGLVVAGGSAAMRERIVAWLRKYLTANRPERSYDSQFALRADQPIGWWPGTSKVCKPGVPGSVDALALPCVYYPCE